MVDYNELILMALKYIEINEERFNDFEKMKFMHGLQTWAYGRSETIDDEVYDFLVQMGFAKKERRENLYYSYLNEKYKELRFSKVLDVGSGRLCHLARILAQKGSKVSVMDPNIRLTDSEAHCFGINNVFRKKFVCDDFAGHLAGTNVRSYNMLIGLEPCDATEHIIRQGLKYDKNFDVLLCAAPHQSINGRKFRTYEEWYEYLSSISKDVDIVQDKNKSYHATNAKQNDFERTF